MKDFIKYTLAATLAVGAAASGSHQHHHVKKNIVSKVVKRDPDVVTKVVAGPIQTIYELGGKVVDDAAAKAGLADGAYVVVGETVPTFSPPPPAPSSKAAPNLGAQFLESKTTAKPTPSTSSAAPPPPPPPKSSAPSRPKPQTIQSNSGSSTSAKGLNTEFPSGTIKCSDFPSDYGAVGIDWLGLSQWSGLQYVPNFVKGDQSISDIISGIPGDHCKEKTMCSYACPPGYQKTQWSSAQGSAGQSIGGLYCNSNGYLELTRPSSKTLCEPGVGGVSIQNDLDELVCTCRTDYPSSEAMVIPATANPGETVPLCNPDQTKYYQWKGLHTTAQYYVNPKGLPPKDACVWDSPVMPDSAGNFAPVNVGVGSDATGLTFISIFNNEPSSHAKLDFNIEIIGDVNSKCSLINGKYPNGGKGCTTAMKPGGKAIVRYF